MLNNTADITVNSNALDTVLRKEQRKLQYYGDVVYHEYDNSRTRHTYISDVFAGRRKLPANKASLLADSLNITIDTLIDIFDYLRNEKERNERGVKQ